MPKTDGRSILSAFPMLPQEQRLLGHPDDRLSRLLDESRRHQTTVSAALAGQVLEGLYELPRGLHAADLRAGSSQLAKLVHREPDHVYAGLPIVMMRLVFVLYAEDRGLFRDDSVWVQNDTLAGLYEVHEREWEAEEGERPGPWRLRWPGPDRDEVLARLLELNRRRHEEETAATTRAPQPSRKRRRRSTMTDLPSLLD